MLTACSDTKDYVEADEAERGESYRCRGCKQLVIFKAGRLRCPHFAHFPDSRCSYGAHMSPEHLEAQRLLATALRGRGVNVTLEYDLASLAGDRRIDVLASPPDKPKVRIAIEVQMSDITVDLIDARTTTYQTEKIAPLWLRLYNFGKWNTPKFLIDRRTIWIERHYLRAWERWAYEQLGRTIWFMDSGTLLLWRGTFVPAHSYREHSSWYDSDGDEQSAGGYFKDISQWVELELEGPYYATELMLKRRRVIGKDGRQRASADFLVPGELSPPVAPNVRAIFAIDENDHEYRQVEVRMARAWMPARMRNAPENWRLRQPPETSS
ncbi:MAG: hypothetical protein DI568_10220 [Sphingomonas sp.]|nr:MAG: hypothetical protein DI568_10220 [Sphingomonas sp.]